VWSQTADGSSLAERCRLGRIGDYGGWVSGRLHRCDEHGRHRQQPQAGLDRVVAVHVLQENVMKNMAPNSSSGPEVMAAAFDAYADQLTAALAGHWS
jgi:hypothetical protein